MSNTIIDKACAVVPIFKNRLSLFNKKLRLAQYAEKSIYDFKAYREGGKHVAITMGIGDFLNLSISYPRIFG